ncbi:hypothetical protein M409DRAFT_16059 [Zasmidium cellare ATCC 36951]|uniref:NAD dependent epimerase/dehydratase n=1 Tax=Zasmidium cellare ATCC 36951 TaxID=1080233 RepID=A0A6A6D306_ZASCE|nr:uncharacterized protein M409DRAFT_16059 [Zasmidium cellare ATCC 36951]KAF2173787.1 hypothetical protein M409DRAFT_16059 [Zasmidium cellare ATCC 36951]
MQLTPLSFDILRLIYPLPEKSPTRDRPLQVLALGISRSGTESLRQALIELGYDDCHHGFRYITDPTEILPWVRLVLTQRQGKQSKLTAEEFDKVLGDCRAVTDTPSCGFANELLDAYPDAKVILNYREDLDAWYRSADATVEKHNDFLTWWDWLLTFFDSRLFWNHQVTFFLFWRRLFEYDFKSNGKSCYLEHYAGLERRLNKEGRRYLKWKVEDDWDPLCYFLDKPVPNIPFPNGNTPSDFEARMARAYAESRANANRNLSIFVAVLVGTGVLLRAVPW